MDSPDDAISTNPAPLVGGKIPVKNVWLLFLYASGLTEFQNSFIAQVEESSDFRSLIARLLCYATERRLRRNLSFSYQRREDVLRRVRGRINILESISHDLFQKGQVACRFAEMTIDTPRNRLIRAAHAALSGLELADNLAHRCRTLAHVLGRAGVGDDRPSRAEMASDQIARNEAEDRLVVSLALAVFDLVLPTEESGGRSLLEVRRDDIDFPKLFEKAVASFFRVELPWEEGWRVSSGTRMRWPVAAKSPGISSYLPSMKTDIILENIHAKRRTIIDTKFTEVLKATQHDNLRFKTGHMYQLYSYVRSQERQADPLSLNSDGVLLYPSVGVDIDEAALIQSHRIRFVTVDLAQSSSVVVERLRAIPTTSAVANLLPTSTHDRYPPGPPTLHVEHPRSTD